MAKILRFFEFNIYRDKIMALNETVKKEDGKYVVKDSKGKKTLGKHKTKKEANKQLAAIEISKKERANEGVGDHIVTVYKQVNSRAFITFKMDSRGMLLDIENPMKLTVPFKIGDYIGRKWRTWASVNGFIQKDESDRNKKIHGINVKDIPAWHPLRYTGRKFRNY